MKKSKPIKFVPYWKEHDQIKSHLDIYNQIRSAHSEIKIILNSKFIKKASPEIINAIEALHASLYMAEYIVCEEENKCAKAAKKGGKG